MSEICNHPKWNIDSNNTGTCCNPKCGERRQFPHEKGEPVVVLSPSKCNVGSQAGETKSPSKGGPRDKGQDPVILTKGRVPGKRERRKRLRRKGVREAEAYHLKNKDAIIADLLAMGNAATCKKWGISATTMSGLRCRWLSAEDQAKVAVRSHGPGTARASSSDGRLPAFPRFSDNWQPEVQLEWLEVYGELATQK